MKNGCSFYKKVSVPLYFGHLHIAIAEDLGDAVRGLGIGRSTDPPAFDCFGAITTERTDKNGITHWYALFTPKQKAGVIAHEAKHIVNFIFLSRGLQLDPVHDEHECYLLGWVVQQIYDAITTAQQPT